MSNITPVDVLEAILYIILEKEDTDRLSSEHFYIQRAIFHLTREVSELKKFFPFRVARKYSDKLDDALFSLNLGQKLETPSNPALRYYQIRREKLEQIGKTMESKLPKELIEAIKEGIERIKETDEYKHLIEL